MDCSPPGSSVHGISQVRVLEWVAIALSPSSLLICFLSLYISFFKVLNINEIIQLFWGGGGMVFTQHIIMKFVPVIHLFLSQSSKIKLLCGHIKMYLFSSVAQFRLFATPWTAACQASLSITNSQSLLKLMSIELVMLPNHLNFCRPLFLPPSIFPSIRVFSNESVLHIRWPKYWSFSFSISPSNEYSGLISFRMDWLYLLVVKVLSRVFSNTTVQKHQFFGAQLSL